LEILNPITCKYPYEKDYVKPNIVVGSYYLKWDISSYGIAQNEVAELKGILSDLLPHISSAIFDAAKEIHAVIKEKTARKARRIEELYSPELLLIRRKGVVSYILRMKRDGTLLIGRSEKVVLNDKRQVCITWFLGELLFDRGKDIHD
jgi:hypothetical protein